MTQPERRYGRSVEVFRAMNRFEAFAVAGLLRSHGIRAEVHLNSANCVYPNLAFVEGMPVIVLDEDAARACDILEDSEFLDATPE